MGRGIGVTSLPTEPKRLILQVSQITTNMSNLDTQNL